MNALLQGQGWHIVGWTMVYFLAAGTVVILVGAALRFELRTASPTLRYTTSLAVFAVLAILPIAIVGSLASRVVPDPGPYSASKLAQLPVRVELKATATGTVTEQALLPEVMPFPSAESNLTPPVQTRDEVASLLTGAVEILPWVWIVGTPLTFLLLASGLVGAERLRKTSRPLDAGPIIETCESLRKALQVGRRVRVAVCERVATPLLVGIVRPLILLPPAALTGWSHAELEMVLLHELAHVRRWDNLVNLAQRVVESLLFFHPAVWIASRWVRHDREDCCDAVVVAFTAKPQAYAELLLALASHGGLATSVAMSEHPVAHRIRRILNLEDEPMLVSRKTLVAVATGFLSLVLTIVLISPHSTDAEEPGVRAPETKASRERQRPEEEEVATEDNESTKEKSKLQEFSFSKTTQIEEIQSFVEFLKSKQGLEVSIRKNKDGTISVLGKALIEPTAHQVHFPSIEEQRAADVAYKLLHLELEKLSEEDLKRVQAMGYQGGMRIDSTYQVGSLNTGDLLVGLHVWPTETLAQVNEILTRDDIDQLSPLKFYVIRRKSVDGGGNIGPLPLGPNQLVTGRISVDLDAWRDLPAIKNETSRYNNSSILPNNGPILPQDSAATPYVNRYPTESKPGQQVQANTQLLYDDMTFDQWKNAWQNDLKTENRTECIKALAAFGRVGMAKEASSAIFDVAGQYDFYVIDDSPEGKLKKAVRELFTNNQRSHLPEKVWLPLLAERLQQEPEKYKWIAINLLGSLTVADPAVKKTLMELQNNSDPSIRQAVLGVILHAILPYESEGDPAQPLFSESQMKKLYLQALLSDPRIAAESISWQTIAWLSNQDLLNLFLNEDKTIQVSARKHSSSLQNLKENDLSQFVQSLEKALSSNSPKPKQLAAMRALASLGHLAKETEPALTRIIEETQDETLLMAALYAREKVILPEGHSRNSISDESLNLLRENERWKHLSEDVKQLNAMLYSESNSVSGNEGLGGGFGGGGGGGFF